ncbi:MAG: glycine--tRNA ligase subunit beta [Pseudomonadota bacterium]
MTTKNLLLELFVEELPPKALKKLGDAFAGVLFEQLKAQGLTAADSALTSFASPRRLAAHVTAVAAQGADKAVSQKLMPVSVGLDASGNATPALLKKLQALGADVSAVAGLKRAPDGKAEALFYDSTVKGATLVEGLQKALLEAIAKLPIPKVMTYQLADGWSDVKFVRPAHGLVALHGSEVVAIEALGLKAGNSTHGHRFEAAVDPVVLKDADSYAVTLKKDGAVIASFAERKAEIEQQLAAAAAKVGGDVKAIDDDALLDEVTALVERPNVLVCEFEKEFLDVPQECLILTMKANQKYFPLLEASGKLSNKFLVVSNISPADASAVVQGNERVVRPRLADAKFFFDQDRKKTLASRVAGLDKVVYHNKLGTLGERVGRVGDIAYEIGMKLAAVEGDSGLAIHAQRAAQLAKADLVTDMVGEFPELQGTMGRYYAINDGVSEDIANAIEDHYKPRFAGDALPRNDVGVVVAIADKLETLVGMFGIGNLPTGDKDPFALRRHALGIIRMLEEKVLPVSIFDLVQKASDRFPIGMFVGDKDGQRSSNQLAALRSFFFDRYAVVLKERGHSPQEIEAVFASGNVEAETLQNVAKRLAAVRAFAALPEAPALAAANKRISNILKKTDGVDAHVSELLLQEPAEKALHAAMQQVAPQASAQFEAGDYAASLQTLAALRAPVDAFFEGVMVNAEQADLRLNRLGLLATLHQAMNRVADLSRLAT